jgi:hypothetical protein
MPKKHRLIGIAPKNRKNRGAFSPLSHSISSFFWQPRGLDARKHPPEAPGLNIFEKRANVAPPKVQSAGIM